MDLSILPLGMTLLEFVSTCLLQLWAGKVTELYKRVRKLRHAGYTDDEIRYQLKVEGFVVLETPEVRVDYQATRMKVELRILEEHQWEKSRYWIGRGKIDSVISQQGLYGVAESDKHNAAIASIRRIPLLYGPKMDIGLIPIEGEAEHIPWRLWAYGYAC